MDLDIARLAMQVAVVIGLNEAIKQAFLTDDLKKYLPLVSIAVGITVCFALFNPGTIQGALLDGVISGLAAVGLFSTVQNAGRRNEGTALPIIETEEK